ncbi:hypothetical protein CTEN210_18000 [Chaetoceros tenuissimus]|uniref:DNA (cytosine-5-)-methyltransferase n=1 Tax=Chaetoceros tenuissimus TaxID=426638 RepID=A0AAD3DBQ6_9STRA|nr:hypothetical protein CTEN210_18000 [Chaetoceros tenuissimus]
MNSHTSNSGTEDEIQCYQEPCSQEDYEEPPALLDNMRDLIGGGSKDDMVECSQEEMNKDILNHFTQSSQHDDDSDDEEDDKEDDENVNPNNDTHGERLEFHNESQKQKTGVLQAHVEVTDVASSSNKRPKTTSFPPANSSTLFRAQTPRNSSRKSNLSKSKEKKVADPASTSNMIQKTFTQWTREHSPVQEAKNHYVNTEKEGYFEVIKRGKPVLRLFKVGEAFKVKDIKSEFKGSIVVIDILDWKKREVIGSVYKKLNDTAVGGIPNEEPFTPYLENLTLVLDRYVKFEEKKKVKMLHLGALQNNFQPPKSSDAMIYDENFNPSGGNKSLAGLYITLKHPKPSPRKEEDDKLDQENEIEFTDFGDDEVLNNVYDAALNRHKSASKVKSHQLQTEYPKPNLRVQEDDKLDQENEIEFTDFGDDEVLNNVYDAALNQHKSASKVKCSHPLTEAEVNDLKLKMESAPNDSNKLQVVEYYCGMGGMSLGFHQSGKFVVKHALDNDPHVSAMHIANFPETHLFEESARSCSRRVKNAYESKSTNDANPYLKVLENDHLHCSTPCQAFSRANTLAKKNGKNKKDLENAKCTLDCIDDVKLFSTRGKLNSFSMENVTGLLDPTGGNVNYMKCLVLSLFDFGMNVMLRVLDASSFGDPQKRERVWVVAWKADEDLNDFEFPEETHGVGKEHPINTSAEALYDLDKVEPCEGKGTTVLRKDDKSFPLKTHYKRETKGSDLVRLQQNEPSNTIIRKGNIMHYEKDRLLTIAEIARLSSFPYDYQFCGTETNHINGIGNAVPVMMARAMAQAFARMYEKSKRT